MNILTVKNLVKTFNTKEGTLTAVDTVSFSVKKGEIFGLLGVNGAGKSTTLNILSGLISPDSGTIKVFGKDFSKHDEEIKQRFNLATAYYSLSSHVTVLQNLKVYARLYNVEDPEAKIDALAKKFMIAHKYNTKIRSLSSGERSRVVIVKALLNDPELLFLDESTAGLDPDMAELTRQHLIDYNKETGCTIIFTSHYMQEVEKLCDRIAFMNNGKIVKVGSAKELVKELDQQTVRLSFSRHITKARKLLEKKKIKYEQEGNTLTFKIKNRQKIIYPIIREFIHQNITFDDIHLEKPTLEEYFIKESRK